MSSLRRPDDMPAVDGRQRRTRCEAVPGISSRSRGPFEQISGPSWTAIQAVVPPFFLCLLLDVKPTDESWARACYERVGHCPLLRCLVLDFCSPSAAMVCSLSDFPHCCGLNPRRLSLPVTGLERRPLWALFSHILMLTNTIHSRRLRKIRLANER